MRQQSWDQMAPPFIPPPLLSASNPLTVTPPFVRGIFRGTQSVEGERSEGKQASERGDEGMNCVTNGFVILSFVRPPPFPPFTVSYGASRFALSACVRDTLLTRLFAEARDRESGERRGTVL